MAESMTPASSSASPISITPWPCSTETATGSGAGVAGVGAGVGGTSSMRSGEPRIVQAGAGGGRPPLRLGGGQPLVPGQDRYAESLGEGAGQRLHALRLRAERPAE